MIITLPPYEAVARVLHQLSNAPQRVTETLLRITRKPREHPSLRDLQEDEHVFMSFDDDLLAGLYALSHEVSGANYAGPVRGEYNDLRGQGGALHMLDMVRMLLMARFDELLSDLCKPLIDAEVKVSFIAPQFWVVRKRAANHKRPYVIVPVTQQQFEDEYF